MILIKFKNLEKSQLTRNAVRERVETLVEKFPDLKACKIQVTLEMENSRTQAGLDQFKMKLQITSGRYKGVIVEKTTSNLYVSLAEVIDSMLETLNRFGDKARVKERNFARKFLKNFQQIFEEK